jgi:hypothetical protein
VFSGQQKLHFVIDRFGKGMASSRAAPGRFGILALAPEVLARDNRAEDVTGH